MEGRGSLLRWLGREKLPWGMDPGEFEPLATMRTIDRAGALFGPGRYFGLEVGGWENLPPSPVMIVSNHSGGTSIPDVWGLAVAWYRHFGTSRPLHPMAHEMIFGSRPTARFFGRRGVLRAHPELAVLALSHWRRDVLVLPGGDLDTWRPYSQRWNVRFGGRTGYARIALRARVPIVPLAHAGAHETLFVLSDGQRFAKAIGLQKIARSRVFPISLSLPWGLTIGPLPHWPTPAKLRYRFGEPIFPPADLEEGREPTPAQVGALDLQVREGVQAGLDRLRRER